MAEGSGGTWDQQRLHYNSHVTNLSTREALQQRSEGPAQELKHFHNHVKRQLLWRFAQKQDRLLDLCCGRGGDLWKWKDCQIKYVKGLDISEREVEEARRRFEELSRRRGGPQLSCEFEAVDWLGERLYEDPTAGLASYGVVTCMFALHYFFVSERSLRTFLQNVAVNLRQGGYFIGTIPNGARVQELLRDKPELRLPMLRLARRWRGHGRPAPFGSGYICDIADTVTASLEGTTEGSLEFLVDLATLQRVAAEEGLHAVCDYADSVIMNNFVQEDIDQPFKRFLPFFMNSQQMDADPARPGPLPLPPTSLEKASSLFVAFVFQKVRSPEDITVPLGEECQPLPQSGGTGGRRRGGGPPPEGGPGMMMGGAQHFHPGDLGGPGPMGHPGGPPYGGGGPYGEGPGYGGGGGYGHGGKRPGDYGPGPGGHMDKRPRYGGPPGGGAYG